MLRAIWTRSTLSSVRWHSELPKKSREQIMKDKTPKGVLDRSEEDPKPYQDPNLPKHPGGVNPHTGEVCFLELESSFFPFSFWNRKLKSAPI